MPSQRMVPKAVPAEVRRSQRSAATARLQGPKGSALEKHTRGDLDFVMPVADRGDMNVVRDSNMRDLAGTQNVANVALMLMICTAVRAFELTGPPKSPASKKDSSLASEAEC